MGRGAGAGLYRVNVDTEAMKVFGTVEKVVRVRNGAK